MRRIAVALVHHPVVDRDAKVVTTAITNLDLHDIARSSRAYGLSDMFVVHPIGAQRDLAQRVRDHWIHGSGARRIPDRTTAMELLRVVSTLDDVYDQLGGGRQGIEVWVTSARPHASRLSFAQARERVESDGLPVLMVFGTGWGLAPQVMQQADACLEAVRARQDTGFSHLSVRAACAIVLDRLLGR